MSVWYEQCKEAWIFSADQGWEEFWVCVSSPSKDTDFTCVYTDSVAAVISLCWTLFSCRWKGRIKLSSVFTVFLGDTSAHSCQLSLTSPNVDKLSEVHTYSWFSQLCSCLSNLGLQAMLVCHLFSLVRSSWNIAVLFRILSVAAWALWERAGQVWQNTWLTKPSKYPRLTPYAGRHWAWCSVWVNIPTRFLLSQ